MKKYLSIIVGLMLVIGALPVLAANEVTINPNVEISVSSYTLLVSGVAKIIDSLSVADSNFTVTLSPGATFSVTSADKRKFSYSVGTGITASTHCTGDSYVSFAASSASTAAADVTVTPSTTETCDGTTTAATVTGSTSGGGGGGGGNNPNANIFSSTQATTATVAQTTTTTTPATVSTPAPALTPATVLTPATSSSYSFSASLKLGSTGTDVTELQNRLTAEGVYAGPVTGYFGPLTQSAVKAYQAKYGIDQLGIVGPATRANLNASAAAPATTPTPATPAPASTPATSSSYSFSASLKLGSTGTDVTELQNRLTAEGVYAGPVTGYFGPLTQSAVKAYQAKYGIDQLGIVGPATRANLNASAAAQTTTTTTTPAPATIPTPATPAPASTPAVTASDTLTPAQVESMQAQLQALQAQLQLLLSQ